MAVEARALVAIAIIIQFSSLLFLCVVNSHKANYRHSTVITLRTAQHKDNSHIIVIIIIK
jgi:hypothetical protein